MILPDGMSLYHGSYARVDNIDLARCYEGKDFGRGFYLTSDENQAERFIPISLRKARNTGEVDPGQSYGYVSRFEFDSPSEPLRVYEFADADASWLWFVSSNRRASLAAQLSSLVPAQALEADIIVGKVANDTTNPVITTYLNGLYGPLDSDRAVRTAVENLMPGNLKDQYCFRSEAAIASLTFMEANRYDL